MESHELVPFDQHPTDLFHKDVQEGCRSFLINLNHCEVKVVLSSTIITAVNDKFLQVSANTQQISPNCMILPNFMATRFDSCGDQCKPDECACYPIIFVHENSWLKHIFPILPLIGKKYMKILYGDAVPEAELEASIDEYTDHNHAYKFGHCFHI